MHLIWVLTTIRNRTWHVGMTYFITFYTSTFIYYLPQFSFQFYLYVLVMGRTPFYRTLNELEHHFSNIERTRTCSSIGDRTRTPYFWLRTVEYRTSNLIGLSLDLINYSSNWLEHLFFEHRTNFNVFIYW